MSGPFWIRVAALLGAIGVVIGAFGAHSLDRITGFDAVDVPEKLFAKVSDPDSFSATELENAQKFAKAKEWLETGVRYHFIHTLALFGVGLLGLWRPEVKLNGAAISFVVGIVIFCGLLYIMSITQLRFLGRFVPIGGLAFILGWCMLANAVKPKKKS